MTRNGLTTITAALLLSLLAGCGRDDANKYELSTGEVASDTTEYEGIDYDLTSDNYRKWLTASAAIDSADVELAPRLDPRNVSDEAIDDAVESLEKDPAAKGAIESAGISVKDYVLTSIALAQSWDAVNRPNVRVIGVPAENVAFLRSQEAGSSPVRARPSARIITDDDDSDSDSDNGRRGRGRGKGRRGSDSDSR